MISGGSGRFDAGEGELLFQLRKFQKWVWSVLFMDQEIYEGSGPKLPLDPLLVSLMEMLQMWIPLYDTDGTSLMNSTNQCYFHNIS